MQLEIERDEGITDKVILIQKAVRGLRARQAASQVHSLNTFRDAAHPENIYLTFYLQFF